MSNEESIASNQETKIRINRIHHSEQGDDEPLEQETNSTPRSPIVVGAEDYAWNPRGPTSSDNHDWSDKKIGDRRAATSFTNISFSNLSLKEGTRGSKKCKRRELVLSMESSQSQPMRFEQVRRRARRKKKDAAKTAATYYGECYLEGVSMNHADKAARESHAGYKKWWLQEIQGNEMVTGGLGDAFNVPIYNPSPKLLSSVNLQHFNDPEIYLKEIGGAANLAAVATHQLFESSSEHAHYDGLNLPDRSSGVRCPSPNDDNRRAKKRHRSFARNIDMRGGVFSSHEALLSEDTELSQKYISVPQSSLDRPRESKASSFDGAKDFDSINNIDPNATTDDDISFIPSYSQRKTDLESERRKRSYRGSGSSSIDDSRSTSIYQERLKRNVENDLRKSLQNDHFCDKRLLNKTVISIGSTVERNIKQMNVSKLEVIRSLAVSGGDVTSKPFLSALEQLRILYMRTGFDARLAHKSNKKRLEGNWLTISRPHFAECLGTNSCGEHLYTLGRMSFDMFAPGSLICGIRGIFNCIETVNTRKDKCALKSIPKSLKLEVAKGQSILRRYDIITTFKVEPGSPLFGSHSPNQNVTKVLRGTIITYGYILPDPSKANRLSIWFSGGRIDPNAEENEMDDWRKAFGGGILKRHLQEKARILAARLLLGATVPSKIGDDGSMEFELSRPIGGHGTAYVDVLYCDENLRIVQGHKGSLFVSTRVAT